MISEPFSAGSSFIHQLDPRIKAVFATLYSFVIALSTQFSTQLTALFFCFVLIFFTRLNLKEIAKRALIVNSLIFLLWLVLPLTFEGEALFHVGPIPVMRPGVILSAHITLKSNAILLIFICLVATISFTTLGHALERLYVSSKIIHLLMLTYRYIFVIEIEYQRLLRAAKIRGFSPGTNMHTYKTFAYFVGMLFVRAASRADRVCQAMRCRGFKGQFYCLEEFYMTKPDMIFSMLMVILVGGLIFLEWSKMI